jgi:carbamoyl-phosphate synthase large subunit
MKFGKKKAVINLAAGESQLIVIKKAKEMGLAVIGVDHNPDAPGFKFCDETFVLSTYDSQPIIREVTSLQERYEILGVVNRSAGPPVVTCAELCEGLNLSGVIPRSAQNIIDKSRLHSECRRAGISCPSVQSVIEYSHLEFEKISFPCVVKPALSIVGKSGVRVVSKPEELPSAFKEAKQNALNEKILVQEYVRGRDVSLMGLVNNGHLYPIVLLDEINVSNNQGNISGAGFAVPSIFAGSSEEKSIISMANEIINTYDLNTTSFNMSCRIADARNINLIEIHLDLGGDLILDKLIPTATNFDFLQATIENLIGKIISIDQIFFKPTAIIYGKGPGLVSQRPFTILQDSTPEKLSQTIEEKINA